jgi:hypothetical protein
VTIQVDYYNQFSNPGVLAKEKSSQGWLAIAGFLLISTACFFGATSALRILFPVISTITGLFLYIRTPTLYIGFTWWLWFLTALLRRLVDFRVGWDQQGVILLAPYLVSLIACISVARHLPKSYQMGALPFVAAIVSVIYAFFVGLINFSPILVARTMLDWLAPVVFGFYLFANWQNYPNIRKVTQNVFLWGVLVMGAYGIYQYLVAPEWDKIWLIGTKMVTFGIPEPLGIRVWSTMHSPQPLGSIMAAGLILLFSSQHVLTLPSSAVGYLTFMLSLARTAWGGWFVGLLSLVSTLKPKLQMRLVISIVVMVLCITPLATIEPFSKTINERFESITNLQGDISYQERSNNYEQNLNIALSSPLGRGIGGTWIVDREGRLFQIVLDSGILDTFFALGWFGAIPYLGGLIILLYNAFQGAEGRSDSFANATRSISLGTFFQMIFGSAMLGSVGILLWGFVGMAMAAKKYHQHQRAIFIQQSWYYNGGQNLNQNLN